MLRKILVRCIRGDESFAADGPALPGVGLQPPPLPCCNNTVAAAPDLYHHTTFAVCPTDGSIRNIKAKTLCRRIW